MASKSLNKYTRYTRVFALLVVMLFVCAIFLACDPMAAMNLQPDDVASRWVCDEPEIVIEFSRDEYGYQNQNSFLTWNGETRAIILTYRASIFWIFYESVIGYSDELLYGEYTYEDGNLVLLIERDNIFGGAYTELVFRSEAPPV